MYESDNNKQIRTIAVSNPGGNPKQFKVQCRENGNRVWRQTAVLASQQLAEEHMESLKKSGLQVRLVHYRLPTAA